MNWFYQVNGVCLILSSVLAKFPVLLVESDAQGRKCCLTWSFLLRPGIASPVWWEGNSSLPYLLHCLHSLTQSKHYSVVLADRCKVFVVFHPPFTAVSSQTFIGAACIGLVCQVALVAAGFREQWLLGCAASLNSQKCCVIVYWAATSRIKWFHSSPFVFQRQEALITLDWSIWVFS